MDGQQEHFGETLFYSNLLLLLFFEPYKYAYTDLYVRYLQMTWRKEG